MKLQIVIFITVFAITNVFSYNLSAVEPQQPVTGTVTDSKGEPLPGVNVVIKGTTIGAITDVNGKYSLTANDKNGTIIFTFIAYTAQEVSINGQQRTQPEAAL